MLFILFSFVLFCFLFYLFLLTLFSMSTSPFSFLLNPSIPKPRPPLPLAVILLIDGEQDGKIDYFSLKMLESK